MRQIGTLHTERDATRFGAYLHTLGIDNTVEPSADSWALWIASDDHLDKARAELNQFQTAPGDARYEGAVQTANTLLNNFQKAAVRRQKNFVDVRTQGSQTRQYNTPLTFALIGISVIVYILSQQRDNARGGGITEFLRFNSSHIVSTEKGEFPVPDEAMTAIRHGEVWRLVTPIFLHFGVLHILFNMFWLRDLGGVIELRRGKSFLTILVLTTAVLSNTGQFYYTNSAFFGGMSGVVYGLFGYVWIKGLTDPMSGIGIRKETAAFMLIWLVACMTGFLGPIANAAHVVGLGVGVLFAYVPYLVRRVQQR